MAITVTVLDCTPEVRHDNYSDRHFEEGLWQDEKRTVSFRRLSKRRSSALDRSADVCRSIHWKAGAVASRQAGSDFRTGPACHSATVLPDASIEFVKYEIRASLEPRPADDVPCRENAPRAAVAAIPAGFRLICPTQQRLDRAGPAPAGSRGSTVHGVVFHILQKGAPCLTSSHHVNPLLTIHRAKIAG
ncbi:hypothetical protein GGD63_005213 [Bradyrhizobium sp. cir1]|nr:hypothetical protein [Bradyrhizobium sp. cir1]